MKRIMTATLAIAVAGVASATVYTWTGGASGQWGDPGNWSGGSGVPNAGDVALFDCSATVTDSLALGAGTLAITNSAGTALTMEGVISGSGGIVKGGDGELHLYGENTFSGGFEANGTLSVADARVANASSSAVFIYSSNSLGSGPVAFNRNYGSGEGARLVVDGSRGTRDFVVGASSVTLSFWTGCPVWLRVQNGVRSVSFSGPFVSQASLSYTVTAAQITAGELEEIVFSDTMTCGSWHTLANYVTFRFHGAILGSTLTAGSGTTAHIYSSENTYGLLRIQGPVVCHASGALRPNTTFGFTGAWNKLPAALDLNGIDQTYTAGEIATLDVVATPAYVNYTNGVMSAAPAVLHCTGSVAAQPNFNAQFMGMAGLEWNPDDTNREFVIVGRAQTTGGSFTAARGTIRIRGGASIANLGTLAVGEDGAFAADSDAGAMMVTNVSVAAGGTLSIASGKTLNCKSLTVAGETLPYGVYTSENLPGVIVGGGEVAVFVRDPNAWIGAGGGRWDDPSNWTFGVPTAGDRVTVSGSRRVVITAPTEELLSADFGAGATVVFSNSWAACLAARTVRLSGATMTCAGPFESAAAKCRVYVRCHAFEMDSASSINVDGKGWQGGHWDISNPAVVNPTAKVSNDRNVPLGGWGPGGSDVRCGASHLGQGAAWGLLPGRSACYDDPLAPSEPGSGGFGLSQSAWGQAASAIAPGGGAVFIDATGAVRIDGQILASGVSSMTHEQFTTENAQQNSNTPGSGGSVRIVCSSISGAGTIRADGGNAWRGAVAEVVDIAFASKTPPPAAGGGGIAIVVDGACQTAGAVAGMTISAAQGIYRVDGATTFASGADFLLEAEPGTVYLSDAKLVDDTIGRTLCGKLVGLPSYTYRGDLDWTYGHVRFGTTGVTVTVTGDLTVRGGNSRLDIGGTRLVTDGLTRAHVSAGDRKVSLTVGGRLTLTNDAALVVHAAEVPGETSWGADVTVAGEFAVCGGATVYPVSDGTVGGAPHFVAESFTLAADGRVNADGRGGAGVASAEAAVVSLTGFGAGGGTNSGGGSHGGVGGIGYIDYHNEVGSVTEAYDDEYVPRMSGSGGGSSGVANERQTEGGDGGGVFHLSCTGAVLMDGVVSADGKSAPSGQNRCYYIHYGGSGAGGTIYVAGSTVSGSATLSARGGDSFMGYSNNAAGCGGGGRVVLRCGAQNEALPRCRERRAHLPTYDRFSGAFGGWLGSVDVGGGTNRVCATAYNPSAAPVPSTFGGAGTVRYSCCLEPVGMIMIVQ